MSPANLEGEHPQARTLKNFHEVRGRWSRTEGDTNGKLRTVSFATMFVLKMQTCLLGNNLNISFVHVSFRTRKAQADTENCTQMNQIM